MSTVQQNMSLTGEAPKNLTTVQKIATGMGWTGIFILFLAILNLSLSTTFLWIGLGLIISGIVLFANDQYLGKPAGIKNDGIWFKNLTSRGGLAWGAGIMLTLFYIVLYWHPQYLGLNPSGENTGIIAFFDPLSRLINGHAASQWFVYGVLYTIASLAVGYKFILKYRHNK